jgi:hypothetical protein
MEFVSIVRQKRDQYLMVKALKQYSRRISILLSAGAERDLLFEQEIAEGAEIFFPLFPCPLSPKPWFHISAPGRIHRTTPSVNFISWKFFLSVLCVLRVLLFKIREGACGLIANRDAARQSLALPVLRASTPDQETSGQWTQDKFLHGRAVPDLESGRPGIAAQGSATIRYNVAGRQVASRWHSTGVAV